MMDIVVFLIMLLFIIITTGCVLFTICYNNAFRVTLLIGTVIGFLLYLALPYLWPMPSITQHIYIYFSISTFLLIIASIILNWLQPNISLLKGLLFNIALYSLTTLIIFLMAKTRPIFDYPNGPTVLNEFWSYSGYYFFEENKPFSILIGVMVLLIAKFIRKKVNKEEI